MNGRTKAHPAALGTLILINPDQETIHRLLHFITGNFMESGDFAHKLVNNQDRFPRGALIELPIGHLPGALPYSVSAMRTKTGPNLHITIVWNLVLQPDPDDEKPAREPAPLPG